jgi:hypothetical protein
LPAQGEDLSVRLPTGLQARSPDHDCARARRVSKTSIGRLRIAVDARFKRSIQAGLMTAAVALFPGEAPGQGVETVSGEDGWEIRTGVTADIEVRRFVQGMAQQYGLTFADVQMQQLIRGFVEHNPALSRKSLIAAGTTLDITWLHHEMVRVKILTSSQAIATEPLKIDANTVTVHFMADIDSSLTGGHEFMAVNNDIFVDLSGVCSDVAYLLKKATAPGRSHWIGHGLLGRLIKDDDAGGLLRAVLSSRLQHEFTHKKISGGFEQTFDEKEMTKALKSTDTAMAVPPRLLREELVTYLAQIANSQLPQLTLVNVLDMDENMSRRSAEARVYIDTDRLIRRLLLSRLGYRDFVFATAVREAESRVGRPLPPEVLDDVREEVARRYQQEEFLSDRYLADQEDFVGSVSDRKMREEAGELYEKFMGGPPAASGISVPQGVLSAGTATILRLEASMRPTTGKSRYPEWM